MPHKFGEFEQRKALQESAGKKAPEWWELPFQQCASLFQGGSCERRPEKEQGDGQLARRRSYSQNSETGSGMVLKTQYTQWQSVAPSVRSSTTQARGVLQIADTPEQWDAVKHWGRQMGTDAIQALYMTKKRASSRTGSAVGPRLYSSSSSAHGFRPTTTIDPRMYQSASGIPKGSLNVTNNPGLYSSGNHQQQQQQVSAAPAGLQDSSSTTGAPRDLYSSGMGGSTGVPRDLYSSQGGNTRQPLSARAGSFTVQANQSAYADQTVPLSMPSKTVEVA